MSPVLFIQLRIEPAAASSLHHHDPEIMTNYRHLLLVLGLLAATPALSAPTSRSFIDGTPQTKTDPHLYPVRFVSVDGNLHHSNTIALTPGPHWLEIEAMQGPASGASKTQTFVLKIQPCTYYYLGARKDPVVPDKWKLVVDEEDTIKDCDPTAELKKAQGVPPAQPPVVPKSHAP